MQTVRRLEPSSKAKSRTILSTWAPAACPLTALRRPLLLVGRAAVQHAGVEL